VIALTPDVVTGRRSVPPRPARGFATVVVPLVFTTALKVAMYSGLRLLIEHEALALPASAGELRRELLMLRVDLTPGGGERIEARSGHDDLADALAMALGPRRVDGGAWRCLLADLVDPRWQLPEPALPPEAAALPTVRTGGGLDVPRTPPWISVRGAEVTPPLGASWTTPDSLPRDAEIPTMRRAVGAPARPPGPARRARPWRRIR